MFLAFSTATKTPSKGGEKNEISKPNADRILDCGERDHDSRKQERRLP